MSASTGDVVDVLLDRLEKHWAWLTETGERDGRRQARAREEVSAIAVTELRARMGGLPGDSRLDELAGLVALGELDAYSAADQLIGG